MWRSWGTGFHLPVNVDTVFVDPELPQPYPTHHHGYQLIVVNVRRCTINLAEDEFDVNKSPRFTIRLHMPEHCFPKGSEY